MRDRRYRSALQIAWADKLKHIGSAALTKYNRDVRPFRPRCGARRKSDGGPCQNLALRNGKCSKHGGKTPKAENWHVRQYPPGSAPNWEARFQEKLRRIDRDRRRVAKRLATMTAEAREQYDQWQRDHRPGSAGERQILRDERRSAEEWREWRQRSASEVRPVSPELAELQRKAADLEAMRDELLRQIDNETGIGVFG